MNVNWKLEPPSLANVNRRKARVETEILIEEETKGKKARLCDRKRGQKGWALGRERDRKGEGSCCKQR